MTYLLIAILLFSFNNVLWKKNLKSISIPLLMTYRSFFTSALAIGAFLFFEGMNGIESKQFLNTNIAAALGVIGLYCMLTILKKTSLQWVAIYNLLGIGFTILYLWIFKNLEIKSSIAGISIITLGFVFYVYNSKNNSLKINLKKHLILVLMTICFGISSILNWENLNQNVPPIFIIANQECFVFLTGILVILFQNKSKNVYKNLQNHFYKVLLMSLVIFLGLLLSFLGLKITNPVISSVLFLANPLTTILLSAYFFKEKIKKIDWISITIIALGAFLLHIQTV